MARVGAHGGNGGMGGGCGCGCGDPAGQGGDGGGCNCGCSTHKPQSVMEEIVQLKAQREQIDRRLDELAST